MAAPGAAQTSASGRATLVVGELLTLRVLEGSGSEVESVGQAVGSSGEAVMVEVVANRRWQLNVVLEAADGRSSTAAPLATGGPGRTPLEVDYGSVLAAAGADPATTVRLTLSPL